MSSKMVVMPSNQRRKQSQERRKQFPAGTWARCLIVQQATGTRIHILPALLVGVMYVPYIQLTHDSKRTRSLGPK